MLKINEGHKAEILTLEHSFLVFHEVDLMDSPVFP